MLYFSWLFFCFSVFGAFLGRFFFGFDLVVDFFGLLIFGIINAHAGQFVFESHDGVAQEHALLTGTHDMQEFLGLFGAKAVDGAVTTIADWFGDTVRAAVHLGHNRGE